MASRVGAKRLSGAVGNAVSCQRHRPFGEPQIPAIDGAQSFAGQTVHSALAARPRHIRKVGAILGTGASCMQIAPEIADRCSD